VGQGESVLETEGDVIMEVSAASIFSATSMVERYADEDDPEAGGKKAKKKGDHARKDKSAAAARSERESGARSGGARSGHSSVRVHGE
jgi:hypothetical protein